MKKLEMKDFKGVDIEKLAKGANFLFGAKAAPFQPPAPQGDLSFDTNEAEAMPPAPPIKPPPKSPKKK